MSSQTLSILAAAGGAGAPPPAWLQFLPLVAMGLIFWFLIIRPQMRRQKEHQTKIGGIKRGDQVVTGGGIVGKITRVDETYADIEIATGVKVKAVKSTIADVLDSGTSLPAND